MKRAPALHAGVVGSVPAEPGAYVLGLLLARPVALRVGGAACTLPAGRYLYCGSARGPGGLRARVTRHLARRKRIHWHVDRLTTRGRVVAVWIAPGGDECALVRDLAGLPVPLPGFGSSDCRRCASHLLGWPDDCSDPGVRFPASVFRLFA
ncbi:Endonuclease III [Rhodovulum sp. PH10]|uniref:GIY-YIG nuclease family protein n=1 Tax=Rhodovulum sp. PH10 TaxID=1187851 RepID=UPI00027C2880|nr:GIY-YIG nuclease family protein [Rhodovulum sp. PH10]EJW13489.1 Endonuclease III [Rhodovulum sp. PH10]